VNTKARPSKKNKKNKKVASATKKHPNNCFFENGN
jgi:hypothetical protein